MLSTTSCPQQIITRRFREATSHLTSMAKVNKSKPRFKLLRNPSIGQVPHPMKWRLRLWKWLILEVRIQIRCRWMGSSSVRMVITLPPRRSNHHLSSKEKTQIPCSISWWRIYVKIQPWKIKISATSSNCTWLERSRTYTNTRICSMQWQHSSTLTTHHKTYQKPSLGGVKPSKLQRK